MALKVLLCISGIFIGLFLGYYLRFYTPYFPAVFTHLSSPQKQVIGFLPYWLLSNEKNTISSYITTLTYFDLRIDTDGSILKLLTPQQEEPGWNALRTGKVRPFFSDAKKHKVLLSLSLATGDQNAINILMSNPVFHAKTLVSQVTPLMKHYGFNDLNIDIESTSTASNEARKHFIQFIQTVKYGLQKLHAGTLTVEISPIDVIQKHLIDIRKLTPIADNIILMAYDYHFVGSLVTGPVAPLYGAESRLEYDTNTAVTQALTMVPAQKFILGVPLYGYEWETINSTPQSGIIPDTGEIASDQRVEHFLATCATCSATFDPLFQEAYIVYKDSDTGTYHQIFYPDQKTINAKVIYARKKNIAGIALWALGYEQSNILQSLTSYKTSK